MNDDQPLLIRVGDSLAVPVGRSAPDGIALFVALGVPDPAGITQNAMGFVVDSDPITLPPTGGRTLVVGSIGLGVNAAGEFRRLRSSNSSSDAQPVEAQGALSVASRATLFNGTTWDRARSFNVSDFATLAPTSGVAGSASFLHGADGTDGGGWRRILAANWATMERRDARSALMTSRPGQWSVISAPGAGAQAAAIRPGVPSVSHLAQALTVTLSAVVAQPFVRATLTDGIATYWSVGFLVPAGQTQVITLSGLNIFATAGQDLSLQFEAAPEPGNFQSVTLTGTSVD